MTGTSDPVITLELHISRLSNKPVREFYRILPIFQLTLANLEKYKRINFLKLTVDPLDLPSFVNLILIKINLVSILFYSYVILT